MSDRDKTRSHLKSTNHSIVERQALLIKYRKLRNQATLQIKKDKQAANAERIKKARNESEVWRIINDISKPRSEATITLIENGIEISEEKELADTLNDYFFSKINNLKNDIDKSKVVDPLIPLRENMKKKNLKFELKSVTVNIVKKLMQKMQNKKSAGADEISQECLLIGKVYLPNL